jgi:NodT family efflux transporter outer membrane factor (OMF) lipoprotein
MRTQARFALVFVAAALAACATDPPPTAAEIREEALPEVAFPEEWKAGATAGPVTDAWLATFADAGLDALVAEALAHNQDLRIAAARVEKSAAYAEAAKAALLPAINLLGTGGLKLGGGDLSSALQGVLLGISWEPDLWGRLRYGRDAAESSLLAVRADYEFARQSLAATTARGWFTATETLMLRGITDDVVKSSQELVALAQRRAAIGIGMGQDVALAQAQLASLSDARRQIDLAHQQALRALEIVLGRYPTAELRARADLSALPGPVPAGMPLEMLERRPDIVAAERRVAAAFQRVGEAKAAMLPNLVLNASASVIDSDVVDLKDDYENPAFGAGGRFVAPLYAGGGLDAQVDVRSAEQREAVADYGRRVLIAIGEVEDALATGQALADRREALERALAENERALSSTRDSFRVGRIDQRAVQQQLLAVLSSRSALTSLRSAELAQRVNLHLVLGGDFAAREDAPPTEPPRAEPSAAAPPGPAPDGSR